MADTNIVRALSRLEGRTVQVIAKPYDQSENPGNSLNDHLCMVVGTLEYREAEREWVINEPSVFIRFNADLVTKVVISEADNSVIFICWNRFPLGSLFR